MNTSDMVAVDNRPVCQPIAFFVGRLLDRGFTMLNNGDYKVDYLIPNDQGLFFRLKSPIKLDTLDLTDDRYYLADGGINSYMCECHFHMVKLVDVV
jgi:hypothetical protein